MLSSWCQWHFYIARATLRIVLKLVELWVVQNMTAAIKLFHIGVRIKIRKIYHLVCRRINFKMSGMAFLCMPVLLKLSTCKSSFCGRRKVAWWRWGPEEIAAAILRQTARRNLWNCNSLPQYFIATQQTHKQMLTKIWLNATKLQRSLWIGSSCTHLPK